MFSEGLCKRLDYFYNVLIYNDLTLAISMLMTDVGDGLC